VVFYFNGLLWKGLVGCQRQADRRRQLQVQLKFFEIKKQYSPSRLITNLAPRY